MASPPRTLGQLFLATADGRPKPDALRVKVAGKWTDISTAEVKTAVTELAAGLAALGVRRGDRVAILAENRPQWLMADYAILCLGAVSVPIYATLIPGAVEYILRDCEAVGIVVSTRAQGKKVAEVRGACPTLRFVMAMDGDVREPEGTLPWDQVLAKGREALKADPDVFAREVAATTPDDLATLIYTSGTTGEPKGVMLSHANLTSNIDTVARLVTFTGDDVALSFLPLSHVFERMADFGYWSVGASIAYAESIDKVPDNMMEIRPTIVASVPRLYEKMYARILERGRSASGLQKAIFGWAMGVGRDWAREKLAGREPSGMLAFKHRLADRLVFRKIRERTGGRLRFFISGGAPLARDIAEFFYGLGILVLEGYGLSETSPVIAVNTPAAFRMGTVGRPIADVEVRIAGDGEIVCRGPNVMKGYFHKDQATAEAFGDGWFLTGDIGHLDADGYLVITDRKKDLFKTSGGKYVAPQPIENRLKADDIVAQAVLIGNSRKFVAALLVPNAETVRKRLASTVLPQSPDELVKHPKVRELFDRHVAKVNEDLSQFEKIKKFELLPRELTLEDGALTPTLKVKRKVVNERFASVIDGFYVE